MAIFKIIFYGTLASILILCLQVVLVGTLYLQRVVIDWLFGWDYIKAFHTWINKDKKK